VVVPVGTSWQDFKSVNVLNKQLTQGQRIVRIVMDTPDLNINYVNVTAVVNDPLTQSYFNFVNKHSTHYLRPKDASATQLIVQDAEANPPTMDSFQWEFRLVAGTTNYYFIINKWTQMAILPTASSEAENATLSQLAVTGNEGNTALHWSIEPVSGDLGYYWIKNRKSNKYIRPAGASQADLANIVQNAIVDASYPSYRWSMVNKGAKAARMIATFEDDSMRAETTSSKVYPNPTVGEITIATELEKEGDVAISMYNIFGKEILSNEYKAVKGHFEKSYDVSGFPAGAFILKIKKGNNVECKKVIKK
jgi:hypothetical protein